MLNIDFSALDLVGGQLDGFPKGGWWEEVLQIFTPLDAIEGVVANQPEPFEMILYGVVEGHLGYNVHHADVKQKVRLQRADVRGCDSKCEILVVFPDLVLIQG